MVILDTIGNILARRKLRNKKIVFVVSDKEVEQEIRYDYHHYGAGWKYFPAKLRNDGSEAYHKLEEEGKCPNFSQNERKLWALLKGHDKLLYRGIKYKDYENFLKYGTTRILGELTSKDKWNIRMAGFKPEDTIHAGTYLDKAWEYVSKKNPSIIVIYDASMFIDISHKVHRNGLYRLKKGFSFFDAVVAHVLFVYE